MKIFILATILAILSGCSSASIRDYQKEEPKLKLEEFFNGTLDAYGIFQDRSGLVVKRFHVLMKASWTNGIGTLDEEFTYSDGSKSHRIWTLKKTEDNKYTGTAEDVIGEAFGESSGNAFQWKYTLDLRVGESTYHVHLDDWMYLMSDRVLLNRSKMTKFGVSLGEITLSFYKRSP